MRKKNSNSSVPSGMHSLAQRSQQERRQKMEQQRVRTVPQEPMRVPPQQPAHFGRQPMQQVPPPPVQKPEKALSQEALQELQQQATQQPEESAVYNRFFADISVEEPQTPKKSAPQKTKAAPPTNSAEPEKPAPKMPPVRDARAMPQMPASAKPTPAEPTPEPPKPVEPQATAESATVSPELLQQVRDMGVEIAEVTLHVGLGTFRPVKETDVLKHHMHSEFYRIDEEAAEKINNARKNNGRIIAVGTTSTRTLESVAKEDGTIEACSGWTQIFIYPGYKFKAIDCLITNFHLPESTLVMLVSALAGRENVLNAYETAVKEKYRFFSFGDAMFIR